MLAGLALIAALALSAVALAVPVNIALRNLTGFSIPGLYDAVGYAILAVTFLAAPWVLATGGHVRVDLLTRALPRRWRRRFRTTTDTLGALASGSFAYFGWQALAASFQRGARLRSAFTFPEWWTLAPLPLAMALICIVFLRRIHRRTERASAPPPMGL